MIIIGSIYGLGRLVQKLLFKKCDKLEAVVLSMALGLAVYPFIFAILYFIIGFAAALYATPLVSVLSFLYSRKVPQDVTAFKLDIKLIILIIFVIIVSSFGVFTINYWSRAADPHFHFSAILDIKNNQHIPPDTACLHGEGYKYSWFYHMTSAVLLSYTNSYSIYTLPVFGLFISALAILMVYLLGRVVIKAPILFTLVIISYFFGTFYAAPGPHSTSLVLIALFFYCLMKYDAERSAKNALLPPFIAASIFYFHGLSFIFSVFSLFSYSLIRILQKDFEYSKAPFLFIPLLAAVPFYFYISSTSLKPFIFVPFGGILSSYNSLGPLLLGLIGAYMSIKHRDKNTVVFVAILITLFALLNTFVMPLSVNMQRFLIFMVWPLSILLIYWVYGLPKKISYAIVAVTCIFLVQSYALELINAVNEERFTDSDEYIISKWIKNNTNLNERFLSAPKPQYLSGSERQVVFCEDGFLRGWFYSPAHIKENFEDEILLYTNPTQDLVRKHNIKYFVLGKPEREFFDVYDLIPYDFPTSDKFNQVFKHGNYTVYSANTEKLPEGPANRTSLNYTAYGRWWEI